MEDCMEAIIYMGLWSRKCWCHKWDSGSDAKSKPSASPIVHSSQLSSVHSLFGVSNIDIYLGLGKSLGGGWLVMGML